MFRLPILLLVLLGAGLSPALRAEADAAPTGLAQIFPGWSEQRLQADYWIARWPPAERVLLDAPAVEALAARALAADPALVDLAAMAESYPSPALRSALEVRLPTADSPRYHADGRLVDAEDHARWRTLAAVDDIDSAGTATLPVSWALVTRRAPVRAVPSFERILADPGQVDLDRLQETALFPGAVVAVLHASSDRRWRFVQAESYAGWVAESVLAWTDRRTALDYLARSQRLIIDASAQLAYTPEAPWLSALRLDMGVRLPELLDWPPLQAVNGQGAFAAHVVQLPTRAPDGRLVLAPALLPRQFESRSDPLPASRANLLRQAFRFLGERYGWGHDYEGRDCSGFLVEVHRSLGLRLPRNSGDQRRSPVYPARLLTPDASHEARLQAVAALQPGDLLHFPGHVAMLLGADEYGPWIIHDVHEGRVLDPTGRELRFAINGVAVTPLLPMRTSVGNDYLQALTATQRILPAAAETD